MSFKQKPEGPSANYPYEQSYDHNDGSICSHSYHKSYSIGNHIIGLAQSPVQNKLQQLYEKCKSNGVQLVFSHVNEQPMNTMRKCGFVEKVGEENFREHIDDALEWAEQFGNEK